MKSIVMRVYSFGHSSNIWMLVSSLIIPNQSNHSKNALIGALSSLMAMKRSRPLISVLMIPLRPWLIIRVIISYWGMIRSGRTPLGCSSILRLLLMMCRIGAMLRARRLHLLFVNRFRNSLMSVTSVGPSRPSKRVLWLISQILKCLNKKTT